MIAALGEWIACRLGFHDWPSPVRMGSVVTCRNPRCRRQGEAQYDGLEPSIKPLPR